MIVKKSMKIALGILLLTNIALADMESAVNKMGKEISQSILSQKKKKIAVIAFANLDGSINDLGRSIANKLTTKLFNIEKKSYTMINRMQLAKILEELKLSSSGLLEPKAMKKIGQLHGVDVLVTGSLTDFGSDIEVEAQAISIQTGGIMAVASSKIPKVEHIKRLFNQNSQKVGASSTATTTQKSSQKKSSNKFEFSNDDIEISYKNLTRHNPLFSTLLATYMNKTNKTLEIQIDKGKTFLASDAGEKSQNTGNSLLSKKTTIDPGRKLVSKMNFNGNNESGTLFNLKAYYTVNGKDIEVKFYDIPIK